MWIAFCPGLEHGLPFVSCCFETRERTLRFEEEGRSASKASHAGIIRIGFEGISQPHLVEHPCFNNLIETLSAGVLQMSRIGLGKRPGNALYPAK
jgi:hypothetical protein